MTSRHPIDSSLLGTAVGDALGLPYEGLTPGRGLKLIGDPDRFRFLPGRGMVSDDTEHACIVAQCLIASAEDQSVFEAELARRLRRWFLAMPAGIGRATLRSCVKLCVGFGPGRSGVFSAGNGPSMRAPVIGAAVDNPDAVLRLNHLSSRITHTDPVAEHGAAAVAIAAWGAARNKFADHATYFVLLRERLTGEHAEQLLSEMDKVENSLASEQSTQEFCRELCGTAGATGYTLHTVPVAIHAWLRHRGNLGDTLRTLILCGGDTDSTAAIAGGIAGCETEVTDDLLNGIMDWPCNPRWISRLSDQLVRVTENGLPERPVQSSFLIQLVRNGFFLAVVLLWGLRRLLPPF
ncbi:MAG: ADP-ribosylglycohydrolase family protein [Fuerstiella sp.]|nr:ADP-ribosylglycohydrolase family protein [Fuerstiella sp.]MCP4858441.1 ADP-ribosylglycohydrolase family protein [Fuerstiella sp.]